MIPTARLVREAVSTAVSRPATTIVTTIMFAVLSCAVLTTAGSAAGSLAATVAAVDSAAMRSVIVRTEPGHGLSPEKVARLTRIEGIESLAAFGVPEDARNIALPDGDLVAVVPLWSSTGLGRGTPGILVSSRATTTLGLLAPSGALRTSSGAVLSVTGAVSPPSGWAMLEPLAVRPVDELGDLGPVATIVLEVDRIASVPAVVDLVRSLVESGSSPVDVQSSSTLAELRARIETQVAGFGYTVTVGALVATAALASGLLTVVAVLTRRDTARRRALGATRATLASLVVIQASGCALLGHALGAATAGIVLGMSRSPQPPPDVILAVGVVSVAVAVVSALGPVLIAVTRDPVRELRVP